MFKELSDVSVASAVETPSITEANYNMSNGIFALISSDTKQKIKSYMTFKIIVYSK